VEKQRGKEGQKRCSRIEGITRKQENKLVGNNTEVKDEVLKIGPEGYLVEKDHNVKNDE
jgi:hypothetical protein